MNTCSSQNTYNLGGCNCLAQWITLVAPYSAKLAGALSLPPTRLSSVERSLCYSTVLDQWSTHSALYRLRSVEHSLFSRPFLIQCSTLSSLYISWFSGVLSPLSTSLSSVEHSLLSLPFLVQRSTLSSLYLS